MATATPRVRPADVAFNRDAILAEAGRADAAGVDLVVFPELCVSSYAIDDLHLQTALLDAVEAAVGAIVEASAGLAPVLLVGAPLRRERAALQLRARDLARPAPRRRARRATCPNYREYYEKRWFAHGRDLAGQAIRVAGHDVPFGPDLIFEATDLPGFVFHMEICEDFWAAIPPSTAAALGGATILANLSASNIVIGKSDERHLLCRSQSARAVAAYVYSAAGPRREHHRPRLGRPGRDLRARRPARRIRALPARAGALRRRRRHRPHPRPSGCGRQTFNDAAEHAEARGVGAAASASSTARASPTSA